MTEGAGAPEPLGVKLEAGGVNVAVYSANAWGVDFCLFDAKGEKETASFALPARTGAIFHGFIPGVEAGALYGLRAHGDFAPERGQKFDPSKLLADPYAFALDRPFKLDRAMFEVGADSAAVAPKCIVGLETPAGAPGAQRVSWAETILYEVNLRGFTRLHPEVPEALRGTFAGLAHPAPVEHLARLGVTSVEIMPAHAFVDERHLPPLGLANAWGYNPIVLGAPDPRLAPGGWREVRQATDALHAAGLEAILDVVLNHSGESDEFGPTLSMRGLDNASYYRLIPGDAAHYVNDMGCGNCLALDREPMLRLSIESLRRWMILGGFDGFRFDLATALGRRDSGFDPAAPLFKAIAADPYLRRAKLIAEPWDIGPGGYRLGGFPAGWSEWNDRYRDAARRFWRGDFNMRGEIATRIAGSRDIFPNAPAPSKSVNFITAHDGFTLADLVSYERKHNEANGEDNHDGANDDSSWNEGVEGPTEDASILAARGRDMRNLLALLFVSRGAPMLSMGAELGHSQNGNNNAYAQDNATSWIDWRKADLSLIEFTRRLIATRRAHPALARDAFLQGAPDASGLPDVEWRDADGPLRSAEQWQEPEGRVLAIVFAAPMAGGVDRVAIAFNRGREPAAIALPEPRAGMEWRIVVSTYEGMQAEPPGVRLAAPARSTTILAETTEAPQRRVARGADSALVDQLAEAAGIAKEWWDIEGARTIVSQETKTALLAAMRLPAATQAEALESLDRLIEEREQRGLPFSIVAREGEPIVAPLRGDLDLAHDPHVTILCEDGRQLTLKAGGEEARMFHLPNGGAVAERRIALPPLPIGRHLMRAAQVECALTVAPAKAYLPEEARRRAFGVSAQLYAQRRQGDQGVGDFSTLGRLGAAAGGAGASLVGVNPLHALFPQDRDRASPYHPSDRRFLDPLHIDALDGASLPSDADFVERALERGREIAELSAAATIDYPRVWRLKSALLEARFSAFKKARSAQPDASLFTDYDRFVADGGESLHRFACFQVISEERKGQDWRQWPRDLRDAATPALEETAARLKDRVDYSLFLQWLADRQLARAAARARSGGLRLGLYRDLAIGAAPDGAEAWARSRELADGVSVGAPPDPFSREGQIWHLPAPDPLALARDGWRGFAELYAANMRHAGMMRIDHAMGLTRLFVIPQGAKPAQGAYVAYPLRDLIGLIALESQRRSCVIVGEDLGTVPDGFREALAEADILGTRVLWFEREGRNFHVAKTYPALAVSCASTHDLPTLAGWWQGADIAERKSLGFLSAAAAARQMEERRQEKGALVAALIEAGLIAVAPEAAAPLADSVAAAIHAFVAGAPSLFVLAQAEDLTGETIATNLPGTDRERPNWRQKLSGDIDALFSSSRARAIIAVLAAERPRKASNENLKAQKL
ncbi:MAG TPA: glycogen debranching protein GlgX [Roseiarcus sp.]|nr:glycogen debranching protein GlgX [Roseiarcus sp.]